MLIVDIPSILIFFLFIVLHFNTRDFLTVGDLVQLEPNSSPKVCDSSKFPHESAFYIHHNTLSVQSLFLFQCFHLKSQSYFKFLIFDSLKGIEVIINDIIIPYSFLSLLPSRWPTSVPLLTKASCLPLDAPHGLEVTFNMLCSFSRQLLLLEEGHGLCGASQVGLLS